MSEEQAVQEQKATQAPATTTQRGRGFDDDVDQGDFLIPRAKVVTFTSNETKDPDETKRIPAGRFINSVSKQDITKEFIPVMRYKNYVRFNAMDAKAANFDPNFELGKMIFSTRDRHDPRVVDGIQWGENNEKPLVQKVMNYLCYFKGENFPLILSFKSTSYKGAQRLNTLLESAGGDMFSNKYKLIITQESKAGNGILRPKRRSRRKILTRRTCHLRSDI